jgi:hypothetical protein
MKPKPIAAGFLHGDNRNQPLTPSLGTLLQTLQQLQQAWTIAGSDTMVAGFIPSRSTGHYHPSRSAELQRHEQRRIRVE